MTPKKLALALAGLAAACALLSYAGADRLRRPAGERASGQRRTAAGYSSYLQIAGIAPMDFDAADKGARRDGNAWVLGDVDLEAVREAIRSPQDLDALAAEDPRWIPTQTWKLRHGGASPFAVAKEHCSAQHLVRLESMCKADVDVVVERASAGEGKVVYARPRVGEDGTDECRAYADCVAKNAWLDRSTPLPAVSGEYYAFQAGDVRLPMTGTKVEWQATMQAELAEIDENLAALRRQDTSDPNIRQNIELNEDLREQIEWMMRL